MVEQPHSFSDAVDLRQVLDSIFAFVAIVTPDGILLEVNRTPLESARLTREDVIGRPFDQSYWMSSSSETQAQVRRAIAAASRGAIVRGDFEVRVSADTVLTIDGTFTPLRNGAGEIHRIIAAGTDITERKHAEKALRASEERFRQIAEGIREVFWLIDPATREVHYASPASARILGGSPETPIRSIDDWTAAIHPDDQDQVRRSVEQGIARGEYEHEYRILRPDGSVRWIRARAWRVPATHGAGALLAGVAEDITDRRELEAQLRQAQKMEGIGQLAGGVAQDFNNLMTVITGYSDLVLESLEPGDANREMLEEILRAGRRAATLTRHLLAFSSRQLLAPKICAMNEIARRASATLASVLGEQVRVVVSLAPDAGSVCVDPDQTEQVLLNLGINARDAMPHGGTLTLETRNVTLGPGDATGSAGVPPGPYVLLSIADSGIGMSPDIQGHLFEPFFTTKEPGQGRGLGLSTVHGFIRQSGGHIEAESAEGVGSTFRIYLPLADAVTGTEPDGQARDAAQGMKTILLVEDEPAVRSLTSRILQRAGYSVLEAESGEEALEILGTRQDAVHLLLTDLVMPGMSGRAVAERVLALRPSIKVMFMSGYTDDMAVRQGLAEEAVTFLSKPFPPLTLASKVRQVLGG